MNRQSIAIATSAEMENRIVDMEGQYLESIQKADLAMRNVHGEERKRKRAELKIGQLTCITPHQQADKQLNSRPNCDMSSKRPRKSRSRKQTMLKNCCLMPRSVWLPYTPKLVDLNAIPQ
jgi:hypothetical protein